MSDEKTETELMVYNTKSAVDSVSASMLHLLYHGAPKMKISASQTYEYLRTTGYISSVNCYVYLNCLLKQAIEHNVPVEEVLGEIQLQLQQTWSALSCSKLGHSAFRSMNLEDIINTDDPATLLRKSSFSMN